MIANFRRETLLQPKKIEQVNCQELGLQTVPPALIFGTSPGGQRAAKRRPWLTHECLPIFHHNEMCIAVIHAHFDRWCSCWSFNGEELRRIIACSDCVCHVGGRVRQRFKEMRGGRSEKVSICEKHSFRRKLGFPS